MGEIGRIRALIYNLSGAFLIVFISLWLGSIVAHNDFFYTEGPEINIKLDPISHRPLNYDNAKYDLLINSRNRISLLGNLAALFLFIRFILWYHYIVPNDDPLKVWIKKKIKDGGMNEKVY